MGVDLHRIGFGISSGRSQTGFGNIVSFPSVSFPAYGSYNSTLNDVTYPIANGGEYFILNYVGYPSQFCDVQVKNDGSGGTYTDWTTATNIQYFDGTTYITTVYTDEDIDITTSCNGTMTFPNGNSYIAYNHNGSGGYDAFSNGFNYISYGYEFYYETCPNDDGTFNYSYTSDGNGGVITTTT